MELKLGADPEMFAKKGRSFVSAHGLIPGDKQNPHPVNKGAVQVDGMALEFNIDPATTAEEFLENINTVIGELELMLPDYTLHAVPTAEFNKRVWAKAPAEAKELGCEPDMNAWTGGENPRPNAAATFRTGAGHVHLGWTEDMELDDPEHIEACRMMGKQLDYLLYLPSLLYDNDKKRRQLYGQPGAIRIKPYGVEYRTLSNFWLRSDDLKRWVFRSCESAFERLMNGDRAYKSLAELRRLEVCDARQLNNHMVRNFNALEV